MTRSPVPWWNEECKVAINKRKQAQKLASRNRNLNNRPIFGL
jgi:hypothetical protein